MNRTINDPTVQPYPYESHDQLREHLQSFLMADNFAKPLNTLKGLMPYEYACKIRTQEPERFKVNPIHHIPGQNSSPSRSLPIGGA